jgi:hypothetical protein
VGGAGMTEFDTHLPDDVFMGNGGLLFIKLPVEEI